MSYRTDYSGAPCGLANSTRECFDVMVKVCKCEAPTHKSLLIIAIECMLLVELRQVVAVLKKRESIRVDVKLLEPDELQLLDEYNRDWVAAWKRAVCQRPRAKTAHHHNK
jgi:hypothetical protein